MTIRHDWTLEEISDIYHLPLIELVHRAQLVHRQHHDPLKVQKCTLLSIKTGGCPEDCAYCPQAARYHTDVESEKLMSVPDVLARARHAKENGSTRFCMGAAWREIKDNQQFERVLEMVRGVKSLDMEVCCTLGMLRPEQAQRLKEAGLHAYNHNIDTSEDYYGEIIGTRNFGDRLQTLAAVREAGISVCTGGIIGLGETEQDRLAFLRQLAQFQPHPESVPINALVPVEGTPLENQPVIEPLLLVRVIATARILMPLARLRLSAGRLQLSDEAQMLCFMAGANSIFAGDKLLTTPNPEADRDEATFAAVGVEPMPAGGLMMVGVLPDRIERRLKKLRRKNRFRELAPSQGIDISSNDYLGLANHPSIRNAIIQALGDDVPLGSGGSRLLRGNTPWHMQLEERLAQFKQAEAALIFNSGFEANVGVLSTLCRPGDLVFADQLVHASMIDGLRQSSVDYRLFPHNDMQALHKMLQENTTARARFILVESLYSMDGDRAPLVQLAELSQNFSAHLIVDEAHATGIFGPRGSGLLEEAGLVNVPLVTVHTCGKAWGSFGAFVSCSKMVKDYLINHCRPFIFTTALPPILLIQWLAVMDVLEQEPWRREKVLQHAARLRHAMRDLTPLDGDNAPIVPIILGDEVRALAAAAHLQSQGFDVRAIRPPSVPLGTSRLRIALNANLKDSDMDRLIQACRAILLPD